MMPSLPNFYINYPIADRGKKRPDEAREAIHEALVAKIDHEKSCEGFENKIVEKRKLLFFSQSLVGIKGSVTIPSHYIALKIGIGIVFKCRFSFSDLSVRNHIFMNIFEFKMSLFSFIKPQNMVRIDSALHEKTA